MIFVLLAFGAGLAIGLLARTLPSTEQMAAFWAELGATDSEIAGSTERYNHIRYWLGLYRRRQLLRWRYRRQVARQADRQGQRLTPSQAQRLAGAVARHESAPARRKNWRGRARRLGLLLLLGLGLGWARPSSAAAPSRPAAQSCENVQIRRRITAQQHGLEVPIGEIQTGWACSIEQAQALAEQLEIVVRQRAAQAQQ